MPHQNDDRAFVTHTHHFVWFGSYCSDADLKTALPDGATIKLDT